MTTAPTQPGINWAAPGQALARGLAQRWWMLLLRGVITVLFGVSLFVWPGLSIISLTLVWGIFAFADGVTTLGLAFFAVEGGIGRRLWIALLGVIGILAGLVAFALPGATALVLVLYIGAWAVAAGVLQIWGAIRLRKEITNEWLMALNGVLFVLLGLALFARPDVGALSVVWLIGVFAVLAGFTQLGLAFRLRKLKDLSAA